jgi:iron complex outermembrane receptor protein
VLTLATGLVRWPAAIAQGTGNPVISAPDAFGLTVGLESVGIYSPGSVRDFSPQAAGNVRIEGLYFDEQSPLSDRVVDSATVFVGLSEANEPFPAPTGIVDYALRRPSDGGASGTLIGEVGPFENRFLSVDASLPLMGEKLQVPLGVEYEVGAPAGSSTVPGYTATIANFGAVPQWTPNDRVSIRGLFDWTDTRKARTSPTVFSGGNYLPPRVPSRFLGQDWALAHYIGESYGLILTARLDKNWSLASGVYRSIADTPVSYADLYLDTLPNGLAQHTLVGEPDQRNAAISGETRLTGRFEHGRLSQGIALLVRGRDELAHYGGADDINAGPASIGSGIQVPAPVFVYSARTVDRNRLWSAGAAYSLRLAGIGGLSLGMQKENYEELAKSPGRPGSSVGDDPLRLYANATAPIGRAMGYAGYTQGLEDSGVAPSSAANPNAVLPASRTWQADGGVRYPITSRLMLITGIFEIHKPYFNFGADNVDRQLGIQRASGLELSVSGQAATGLTVNAGAVLAAVEVTGPHLFSEGIGSAAVGQTRDQLRVDFDYAYPQWHALSLDLTLVHWGRAPATVNNQLYASPFTTLRIGGRYRFELMESSAMLRLQVQNLTNIQVWNIDYSPGFYQFAPRALVAYVTVALGP